MTATSRFTIGQKLAAGFGVMLAVNLGMATSSLLSIRGVGDEFEKAANVDTHKLDLVGSMQADAAEMFSCERGALLHASINEMDAAKAEQESFQGYAKKLAGDLDAIRPLLATAQGKADAEKMTADLAATREGEDRVWPLARSRKSKEAIRLYQARLYPLEPEMQQAAGDLMTIERKLIEGDLVAGRDMIGHDRWTTLIVAAIFIGLGTVVMWVVRSSARELRRIAAELKDGKDQVSSAASQMAASSQSLAQGASEQAASLEETSASVEEITSMVKKNAENSRWVAGLMGETEQLVKNGNRTLEQMVVSMSEINSSSDKIAKIIKVIDEIAFQTNILALNAAVEAARAGEAGMGFAVVADEVRNLAQRSAQAAKDTAALIEESIAKSNEGSSKLQQVADVIRAITDSSAKVKVLVDEVNLGSQEQSRGIDEISKAVQQMSQLTQTTAAGAEESAAAGTQLAGQAASIDRVVTRLRVLVEHSGREAPAPPKSGPAKRSAGVKLAMRPVPALAVKSSRSAIPLEEEFTEI